jgi:TIR domain/Pentapeptide repeats (8 copies)
MGNPEHLEILKQGVEQWNEWRKEDPEVLPDFNGVDLSGANLEGANLDWANLSGADLLGAALSEASLRKANLSEGKLQRVDLSRANLIGSDLIGASAPGADLNGAYLMGAHLRGANLYWAILRDADLGGTDFTGAWAGETNFADVDLSAAKGLETVKHLGPSTIGIDTIYKSRGKIPEVFLRGCGVPEEFIDFIRQMGVRPIEFYSCFISYSSKDQDFAERLHADLQAKGVRCWFAPEEMKAGRKLHEQIDEAIRLHDKLLLILSEHSMSSNWVKSEIANAREREKREGKQLLFPITLVPFNVVKQWKLFDADIGIDSAREIREYFIPDFSNWKDHDSYQAAFQRLVKDLKARARSTTV